MFLTRQATWKEGVVKAADSWGERAENQDVPFLNPGHTTGVLDNISR